VVAEESASTIILHFLRWWGESRLKTDFPGTDDLAAVRHWTYGPEITASSAGFLHAIK
jgi:hypothetical protein